MILLSFIRIHKLIIYIIILTYCVFVISIILTVTNKKWIYNYPYIVTVYLAPKTMANPLD